MGVPSNFMKDTRIMSKILYKNTDFIYTADFRLCEKHGCIIRANHVIADLRNLLSKYTHVLNYRYYYYL